MMRSESLWRKLLPFVVGLLLFTAVAVALAVDVAPEGTKGELFPLSRRDRAWIAENPVITVGADPEFAPIEYMSESGEYIGITADFLALVTEKTGLVFRVERSLSWEDSIAHVKSGKIDMLGAAVRSEQRSDFMEFSAPYAQLSGAIIVRKDVTEPMSLEKLAGMKVTVVRNYIWRDFIEASHPELQINPAPDIGTALKKVSFGMSDAMVGYVATASHHIERHGISNLRVSGETVAVVGISFAVRRGMPELVRILDKVLADTSQKQRNEIRRKWIRLEFQAPVDIRQLRQVLFFVLGAALLVLTGIMVWNSSLRRQVNQRTEKLAAELEEKRRMERALREGEEKYRGIFENIQDVYYEIAPDGTILEISPSIEKVFRYERQKMVGQSLAGFFVHPEDLSPVIGKIVRAGRLPDHEILLKRSDGAPATCSMNAMLVRDKAGRPSKIIGSIRNITTRVQAQRALKKAYHELEKRVEERTAELSSANRAFKRAKETADAATRTKSDFLANMSHEIRTPMNGVIAASELVMNETLPPRIAHYMGIINASGRSLLEIIDDILDFSKIEAGKLQLEIRPFRLDRVIARVVDVFRHRMAEKGIRFKVEMEPDAPDHLLGDYVRLQQILTNLVGNAVKFTDAGGRISLGIRSREGGDGAVSLEIFVQDSGIGIAPEHQDLLFTPFSQVDASTTRNYGGTGLGLSICGQLVEMMGGGIRVDSRTGEGSRFTFTVSLNRPETVPPRAALPEEISGCEALVAVADPGEGVILQRLLSAMGPAAALSTSGSEAATLARQKESFGRPFGLILVDAELPGAGGIAAAAEIRSIVGAETRVLLIPAFGKTLADAALSGCGANGIVTRPITRLSLLEALTGAGDNGGGAGHGVSGRRVDDYRSVLEGRRVLVAEDNPTNQEITLAVLRHGGIAATVVSNGLMAVEAVGKERFDAVLMDIQMPELDGFEATRIIRKDPAHRKLPIIAMTANTLKGAEKRCMGAGMNGYIAKPVSQEKLFEILGKWIAAEPVKGPKAPSGQRRVEGVFDAGTGENSRSASAIGRLVSTRDNPSGSLSGSTPGSPTETEGGWDDDSDGEPQVALPLALPGIRIRSAMAQLAVSPAAYLKILRTFLKDFGELPAEVNNAWEAGDFDRMMRRLHTLKGSAAGIGASELRQLARSLEEECMKGDLPPLPAPGRIAPLSAALDQVLGSIRTLADTVAPAPGPAPAPGGPVDPEEAVAILERLAAALSLSSLQTIEEQFALLEPLVADPAMALLKEQIALFDYEPALTTLCTIRPLLEERRS